MKPKLILFIGFGCLVSILLLGNVEANPLITLKTNIYKKNTDQKLDTHEDDLLVAENRPLIKMFGGNLATQFDPKMMPKNNNFDRIEPRAETTKLRTGGGAASTAAGTKAVAKEWTISIPRFRIDAMGNWVYNPWGVTYGRVWADTRFNLNGRLTIPRMRVKSKPVTEYYPYSGKLKTVCIGKSTVYNNPRVLAYLKTMYPEFINKVRPIMRDLRKNLFKKGNSEQCHTVAYSKFRDFQECMVRRNQRMEYLMPKYPRHQVLRTY